MEYSTREITIISIISVITVVIGYILYIIGSFIPLPGHKLIILAPFLGFMIYIPVYITKKNGVIIGLSIIFAFLMFPINFLMSLAIFLAGISTEFISIIFFRNYNVKWKRIGSAGFYPVASLFWAFIVSNYFTGNLLYQVIAGWQGIFLFIFVYILGIIGSVISNSFVSNYNIYKR